MLMKPAELLEAMSIFSSESTDCAVDTWSRIQVHTGLTRVSPEKMKKLDNLGWNESYHGEDIGWMYEIGAD